MGNLPNPEIDNPDNIANSQELAALALSFTNPELVNNPSVWAGTLIIGNRYTSLRLEHTTWLGGQIILAGGELELSHSSVLCGKYSANALCGEPVEPTKVVPVSSKKSKKGKKGKAGKKGKGRK